MCNDDLIVHAPMLDAALARQCYCPSKWFHLYGHCSGTGFPNFCNPEDERLERQRRLEWALRDHRETFNTLEHDGYWDLWQALMFHNRDTFLWFLQMEPNRVQYYWNSRTMLPTDYFIMTNANLAMAFTRICNIGRIVLGKLLQPNIHEIIFGEPITQYARECILRAKERYIEVLMDVKRNGYQFGDMPITPPIYQHQYISSPSNTIATPVDFMSGSEFDMDPTIVDEIHIGSPEEMGQERHDSGILVEGKEPDADSISITSEDSDNNEDYDLSDYDRVPAENVPDAADQENNALSFSSQVIEAGLLNEEGDLHQTDGYFEDAQDTSTQTNEKHLRDERNGDFEEALNISKPAETSVPPEQSTFQDTSSESEVRQNDLPTDGQDETDEAMDQPHDPSSPTAIAALAEQLVDDLETSPDSGFEIAQNHPETVLALQFIMALGRSVRARDEQQEG